MSNSVDPDEMTHHEPSHLDLRCLQKPMIMAVNELKLLGSNDNIDKSNI